MLLPVMPGHGSEVAKVRQHPEAIAKEYQRMEVANNGNTAAEYGHQMGQGMDSAVAVVAVKHGVVVNRQHQKDGTEQGEYVGLDLRLAAP